jgi:RNA polymerase sigma factor (sigma-70 family)
VNRESPGSKESGEESVRCLLDQLSSGRADLAWTEFLSRHSGMIMQTARQFASGTEQASDCFLFACERLSDYGFRRLRSFRPDGPARFETWLRTVVANLCIDWQRKQHGRIRPFANVSGLPPFDQQVFRHIYERGMTRTECQRALASQFPNTTIEQVAEANARLFRRLSSRQRWQLTHRSRGTISLEHAISPAEDGAKFQPEDPGATPDQIAEQWRSGEAISKAFAKLPPRQRLLLRLRYEQDLTLEEVAKLVGLTDPYRANREIQTALGALAAHLPKDEW